MKAHEKDTLWREIERTAADLNAAKARGAAKAAELGYTDPTTVHAFEHAWLEQESACAANRLRSLCDMYLKPKRARRPA